MAELSPTGLGPLSLSAYLVLDGLHNGGVIDHNAKRTLGGRLVVDVRLKPAGCRPLSLSGINHFTLSDIEAIRALGALGQAVTLVHHRGTFNVLITSVDPEPAVDYANPDPDDWYSATIYLQEV